MSNDRAIFRIFLFVLIFSPLAFGAVETWSLAVMEVLSFLALFLLLSEKKRNSDKYLYEMPAIIPLILLSTYILIQLVPLPPGIMKIISPGTYDLYRETVFAGEPGKWISLSIDKKATMAEFFRISSYAALYVLAVQFLAKRENLKRVIAVIIVFASLLSFFGILQYILSNNKIYFIRRLTQGGTPFGPYVNRNHYAGLMEMIFPLALSLFLFYKPHVTYRSLRDRLSEAFNLRSTNVYVLLGFSAVLIATSIFLTLSRSGIVSLCLSLLFFGMMFLARRTDKRRGVVIIVVCVLVILSVAWFGWGPIFDRFEKVRNAQGDIAELRLVIWKDSVNIIRDFPFFGTGQGSFIDIYPKYRTIRGDRIIDHAHNDYMEILSNGGIIALIISAWFLFVIFYKSFKVFRRRFGIYSIYLYIGSVTGVISILIHSITDFNLYIGANGLYLFFLAGLIVSAANTRLKEGLNDTCLKKVRIPGVLFTRLIGVVFLVCLIFNTGVLLGGVFSPPVKGTRVNEKTSRGELVSARGAAYRASLMDPLEASYRYSLANIEKLLSDEAAAVSHYREAVELSPVNAEYLQRFGLVMSELKRHETANNLLRSGIRNDASNPARYKRYALWLFSRGDREGGISFIRKAMFLEEPARTREYITLMILNRLGDQEILSTIPERVEPHLIFADYLYKVGQDRMAEEEYLNALRYVRNEDTIRPSFFHEVCGYYIKKGRTGDALNVMRKAMEFLPDDVGIRLAAAGLYEKTGSPLKAVEEYRKAMLVDPKNSEAKKKLDALLSKTGGS